MIRTLKLLFVFASISMMLAACQPRQIAKPVESAPAAQAAFTDPFAYCAAKGTIDKPGADYTGEALPEVLINAYKKAAGLESSSMPSEVFKQETSWRCMDGKVYACSVGANLPCQAKVSTDKTPSPAIVDFCKTSPDADVIPMSVTGHETIFSWRCVKGAPEAKQVDEADAQGYMKSIWYELAQP